MPDLRFWPRQEGDDMTCHAQVDFDEEDINGECQDCGTPTSDGVAAKGCGYSRVECETCGWSPCDLSC